MITRSEQKFYENIKQRMLLKDKHTQTESNANKRNDSQENALLSSKKRKNIDSQESEYEDSGDDDEFSDDDDDYDNEIKEYLSKIFNKHKKKNNKLEDTLCEEEEHYFNNLTDTEKDKYIDTYQNIVHSEQSTIPIKFQILNADIDTYVKYVAFQKYEVLMEMETNSGEYHKLYNWILSLCKIPFGKYITMPVNMHSKSEDIKTFITNTQDILNKDVYGHFDAKNQIIRIVAQWIANPSSKGNVIGIHGNPGVGKTTLIKNGVCKALNLPFAFIPLGGANDSAYLDGHSYTYEGSSCGKIIDVLMKSKCMNPVLYFDELDKVSDSAKGQEIINVLIHLTDPSQNNNFYDKYFSEIPIDISKCLIIFTYNNNHLIDPILKDRMITIHTKNYTSSDKIEITKKHLLPNIKRDFDFESIQIGDSDIQELINRTEVEAGVRNLKRSLEFIVSNMNLEYLMNISSNRNLYIDNKTIDKYIKYNNNINPSIAHLYT